jgi:hypothetical protein
VVTWSSEPSPSFSPCLIWRQELDPLGYLISMKSRVLDVIEAAAENPAATAPVGASVGAMFLPAIREAAGPLGPKLLWLRPGDWDFAFRSHFDFVVHAPFGERWPTQGIVALPVAPLDSEG